jgi:hypothetical protein
MIAGFLDPRKGSELIRPRFLWSTGVTDPGYSDAHSHANFSNLQCDSHPAGGIGAVAGDEF